MQIDMENAEGRRSFSLPSGLVLNRAALHLLLRRLGRKHGFSPDPALAGTLLQAVRAYGQTHPDWVLVEIRSADGETIRVVL